MTSEQRRSTYVQLAAGRPQYQALPMTKTIGAPRIPRFGGNQVKRNARVRRVNNAPGNFRPRPRNNAGQELPSLLSVTPDNNIQPKPLFDPETIEKLRASLRSVSDRLDYLSNDVPIDAETHNQNDDEQNQEYDLEQGDNEEQQEHEEHEDHEDRELEPERMPRDMLERENEDCLVLEDDDCIDLEPELEPENDEIEPESVDDDEPAVQNVVNKAMDIEKYLEKERETKKQIDEIIMVAQALREKLERDEEVKRKALEIINNRPPSLPAESERRDEQQQSPPPEATNRSIVRDRSSSRDRPVAKEQKQQQKQQHQKEIPRLMDLKPRIPSLLDLNVTPPPLGNVIMETIMVATTSRYDVQPGLPDVCWNCDRRGHRYFDCRLPKLRQFCFHCGRLGFDVSSCPYCTKYT